MSMQFSARIPARAFGFESDKTVLGFQASSHAPSAPVRRIPVDPDHLFDASFFEEFRLWWEWGDTGSPLYISGPSGCGKTTGVLQFLARVNAPVVTITCRARMDKSELIGQWGAAKDGFRWFEGPAAAAWSQGAVLVINEFSLAPPEVWVAANDLFEGDDLTVEKTGRVIARHPNARVVITDNARTLGGTGTGYRSRYVQDVSTAERFWHIRAGWPSHAAEARLFAKRASRITQALAKRVLADVAEAFAQFALLTRNASEDAATVPLSTRTAVRMCEIFVKLIADGIEFEEAVRISSAISLGNAMAEDQALALTELAHFALGGLARHFGAAKEVPA